MPAGKKKVVGLKKWLKENNRTPEEMQKYWDELIEINSTVRALHNSGYNWDETNLSILAQLPFEKERTLKVLEERRVKEEKEKAELEAKLKEEKHYNENFEYIMLNKLDNNVDLTDEELSRLVGEYEYSEELGSKHRWTQTVHTVVKLDNRFFMVDWEQGLTEYQPNSFMTQPYEVEEYEKIIVVKEWRRV